MPGLDYDSSKIVLLKSRFLLTLVNSVGKYFALAPMCPTVPYMCAINSELDFLRWHAYLFTFSQLWKS